MSNLQHRQSKIQEKRKQTPFREFVMEIGSHFPVNLYRNQGMISKYPETDRVKNIILAKNRDRYDLVSQEYTGNFHNDICLLLKNSYLDNINLYGNNENCDYAEAVYGAKNWYLSFSFGDNAENIMYSCFVRTNVTNIFDSFYVEKDSSNIYRSYFIQSSFNIFYSKYITSCNNIWLSTNLTWCSECIWCNNLENQSYCINNQQYSKDEYIIKKQKILSRKWDFELNYLSLWSAINKNTENCAWVAIYQCNNIENWYLVRDMNDSRNIVCGTGWYTSSSHIYDGLDVGLDTHHMYATGMAWTNSEHLYCCSGITKCSNLFYCYHLESCSFCLGCIWLKNKSYCILNKQYTKEEWYEKVDEIFAQMEVDGTLGQFFPASMNPFYFNDTAACLIDPSFTKEEVTAKWYLWRDEPIKVDIPEGAQTVKVDELDQFEWWKTLTPALSQEERERTIDESICKKVILDQEWNAYRIIPMELEFLRKHGLPLPRKHWLERMKENFRIN